MRGRAMALRRVRWVGAALALTASLTGTACAAETPLDDGARAPEIVAGGAVVLVPGAEFAVGSAGGYAMDVSRDGSWIGVGGRYGDVVFVYAGKATGPVSGPAAMARFSVHAYNNAVESLGFSPDGKRCVTAALGGDVIVWDVGIRKALHRTPGGSAAAWSADGKWIAYSLPDSVNAVVLDAATYGIRARVEIEARDRRISRMRFAADSKSLALATDEGTVCLFDAETGERGRRVVVQAGEPVYAFAVLADGRVAAGARKGRVRIGDEEFDLAKGVSAMAVSPDGTRLVLGGTRDGAVTAVDLRTLERTTLVEKGSANWVGAIAFSPDGGRLHWIGDGGPLTTLRDGTVVTFPVGAEEVTNLAFTADGSFVAASSPTGVGFGGVAPDALAATYYDRPRYGSDGSGSGFPAVAAGRGGTEIVLLWGNEVRLLDAATGAALPGGGRMDAEASPQFYGAWTSPDGATVVASSHFEGATAVSIPSGRCRELDTGHGHPLDVAWSPDGKRIALALVGGHHGEMQQALLGTADGTKIDFGAERLVSRFTFGEMGGRAPPWSVAFSPSGKRLIVCDSGETVEFDPATRAEVRRTKAAFRWMRFLDEETALASSGEDLVLWDTRSDAGTPLLRHPDLRAWALARDGSALAVATRFRVFVYRVTRRR